MEAQHTYVQQLLDRAANLIQPLAEGDGSDTATQSADWLQEYHQEKARFGQPEGSPAYAETRGEEPDSASDQPSEGKRSTKSAPRAKKA